MFSNKIIKQTSYFLLLILGVSSFSACEYEIEDLGPKPTASFSVAPISGRVNRYLVSSTSQNAFIYEWDKGNGVYVRGNTSDTLYFPDKGTYTVRLLTYGPGGMDSSKQTITVAADDPAAQTPIKMLTNNSSKKWKLAPEANALMIGPPDFSQVWWGNSVADIATRSCHFNDEITFNVNGNMVYDNKGDIWVDEEGGSSWPAGMPAVGCHPNSAIPAQFKAWTGGNFTFELTGNSLLKVNGTGAFIGLYKAGNPPNAAVPAPQSSITYQIVSLSATRLVVKLDYGWGAWRFTFVPA